MSGLGRNQESDQIKQPQYTQTDTMNGATKGFIVDTRDPWMQGRFRVASYGVQGDYPQMDISCLSWVEPKHGLPGSFNAPVLGARVWLDYEAGDMYTQIGSGYWSASPQGDGLLPWNKSVGSDIRPEVRNFRDLVPESVMIASAPEGNCIWFSTKYVSQKYLASSINLMDTAGKFFSIESIHTTAKPYMPVDKFPDGEGGIYNTDFGDAKTTRTGYEPVDAIAPQTGSVSFGHQSIKRKLQTSSTDYSIDQLSQSDSEGNIGLDSVAASGVYKHSRIGTNTYALTSNAMHFITSALMSTQLQQPPRIW